MFTFQSTLPHGSDQQASGALFNSDLFQSTLPHGSDSKVTLSINLILVSIHAPSRERLMKSLFFCVDLTFQSTLPHGSDGMIYLPLIDILAVSIHAPSRERPQISTKTKSSG